MLQISLSSSEKPCIDYFAWQQSQKEITESHNQRQMHYALQIALSKLQCENPKGYDYIVAYYFGTSTQEELGIKHQLSRNAFQKRLMRSLKRLRQLSYQYLQYLELLDSDDDRIIF